MTEHRPWFTSYPSGAPHTLEPYPELSLFGMLESSAGRFPKRPALAWFGRHVSYRMLLSEVERFSAVLAGLGVQRGDRVALILPNTPQYVIAYYAAARLGAIVTGNNPMYTQREMEHQLRDSGPRVVVVFDQFHQAFAPLFRSLGIDDVIVTSVTDSMPFPKRQLAPILLRRRARAEGKPWPPIPKGVTVRWWRDLMRSAQPVPPVANVDPMADPAAFSYTGGTTGPSKGAMLSHRNLVANAMQTAAYLRMRPGEEVILCALPFFHAFGMLAMNVGLNVGGKIVVVPNPRDLHFILKQTQKEKPSFFPGVPRMYVALNESPLTRKFDLRSIRACVSGAAPLPQAVAERFAGITGGARLVEGYGMTESSPVTHANPVDGRARFGTIGMPLPDTECRIVDLTDPEREVPLGERGELCIRGPQVMLGYWNRPEETALAIRNGWLHTGDIAVMEPDGFFRIVDRLKEMIIVSGFNVYPTEVEEVLFRHPKIAKVCVAGVPDERTGEAVKAYVVLKEDEQATAEEILAWAEDPAHGLSGYHVPKQVEFRESLPETQLGKVLRRVLQEEERQKRAAATTSAAH
ncbi:MAG TPA: long-chain fatty acid--CoA ligase [Actinomycetota bacterium]